MGLDNYMLLKESPGNKNSSANVPIAGIKSLLPNRGSQATPTHEIFGFRRFARNYFLQSNKEEKQASRSTLSSNNNNNNIKIKKGSDNTGADDSKLSISVINPGPHTQTHLLNVKGEFFDGTSQHVEYEVPELYQDDSDEIFLNSSNEEYLSAKLMDNYYRKYKDNKTIVMCNLPYRTGIGSILSQVTGGPLENLMIYKVANSNYVQQSNENNLTALKKVEITFMNPQDASQFMSFGRTSMFRVNGIHIKPEWSNNDNDTQDNNKNFDYKNFLKDDPNQLKEVSRCIILKKFSTCSDSTNNAQNHRHNNDCIASLNSNPSHNPQDKDNGKTCRVNMNISELREDFGAFGSILEVTPIISRKLCFSISYQDVGSAVKAMHDFDNIYSSLHNKYFKKWTMWYGKDITDRPCLEL